MVHLQLLESAHQDIQRLMGVGTSSVMFELFLRVWGWFGVEQVSQPSGVPTRPLQGFKGGRPDGGAPGGPPLSKEAAQKEAAKYNMMAPPTAAYTADLALARASAAMEGGRQQVPVEVVTHPGTTAGRCAWNAAGSYVVVTYSCYACVFMAMLQNKWTPFSVFEYLV